MEHLQKAKKEYKKLKKQDIHNIFIKNELDEACFQHDITRRTASDKILCDKAFNIAKNPKCYGYQRGLASLVNQFCDRKSNCLAGKSAFSGAVKIKVMPNKKLAEELHKPIFRTF